MHIKESVKIGDKTVTLETGRIAKQAGGSIMITCGETMVLCTVCGTTESRPGQNFLPLTVDYMEKTYAAGKIPGGFFKREGRLREHEILTSRLIDRPFRPLFPEGYRNEIQIVTTVMSSDMQNPADALAVTGASAALHLSAVPWAGPVAGVRVGRVNGAFIANPTYDELKESDLDIIMAASKDAVVMVEGGAKEIGEDDLLAGIEFGHQAVQGVLALIEKMREAVGKEKWIFETAKRDEKIDARVKDVALDKIQGCCNIAEKFARYGGFKAVKKETVAALAEEFPGQEDDIKAAYEDLQYYTMRRQVVHDKRRVDGRDLTTVRPISIQPGLLPRVHGSALFTRGETQAIVTATLGTRSDEQKIDGLVDEYWKGFMLHYNFPPYSVGECRFMRGPGRREIGHGHLAERALEGFVPSKEEFPYTIRIVSEITESNGSSSMASVCGGSLALMDAGVPMKSAVAGVAMGLIAEDGEFAVLTDILGDEDHLGDMDFKVCGTTEGITAIQMDIKIQGLAREIMQKALHQAKDGRIHILGKMNEVLAASRPELSKYAPRITTIKVKPDQIRLVIGPGGKMIKAIVDQTGVKIDVSDDGTVAISSSDSEAVLRAIAIVEGLTTEPEVGAKYKGVVRRIERYGAFLEIMPGSDGLLHVTDMDWGFVENVEDLMKLGDEVEVVVSSIDREGRVKLSRKELIEKPEGYVERPPRAPREGGRDGDRGGRDGGRGGRDGGRGGRDGGRGGRGGPGGGRDGGRGGRGGPGGGRGRDENRSEGSAPAGERRERPERSETPSDSGDKSE
ncbi:MAG: polyribonucleotide nucleotidyltransferase [Myxococcales bacterium]|nr:polyribonucleotide nucleotidyltransferase [Myxococcales bacterium]